MRTSDDVLNLFEQLFEAERDTARAAYRVADIERDLEVAKRDLEVATGQRDGLQHRLQSMARKVAGVPDAIDESRDRQAREFVPMRRPV